MGIVVDTKRLEDIFATLKITRIANRFRLIVVFDREPKAWTLADNAPNLGAAQDKMAEYAERLRRK